MSRFIKHIFSVLTLLIGFNATLFAQNLLVNGDFESGGAGVGFQTNYFLPATAGSSTTRNYSITTDSFNMNTANFCHSSDHTSGTGKMMVVDGSGNGGDKVWELINGSTLGVISGRTYQFSYWIRSISGTNTTANSAMIALNTNGTTGIITLISGATQCPTGNPSAWTKVTYQWTATTNNAQIWLTDTQSAGGGVGNDFAIDDISLVELLPPLSISATAVNPTCPNANNGTIVVSGVNGVPPYVTYTLSGTNSGSSPNGVFTNLTPGTYSVSVVDSNGTQVSQNGISIVDPANISITASATSICAGNTVTLTANGASTYTWSSTPNDPGITNLNATAQTVQPTVPTTYTITATTTTTSTNNLIANGDFSSGNTGFTTNYQYLATAPVGGVQNAYGVVTNPQAWFSAFTTCGDHTTGSGKMMVVDGTATSANSILWKEIVPVINNATYAFSFWVQSVVNVNPANIEVLINGVSVGFQLAPTNITCNNWVQFTYSWNSLTNTTASIVLYDRTVISNGNDFAIDDIAFVTTTTTTCNLTASKVITVTPIPTISASVTTTPSCTNPLGTITVSSPVGATYEYSADGTTFQSSPIFSGLAANTYSITVRVVGTTCPSLPVSLTISSVPAVPNVSATTGVAPNCGVKLIGNSTTIGVQLSWNGPGIAVNSANPATATQNGTFTLTALDPVSGCSNATTVAVTLPTLPTTPLINTTQPSCVTATGSITVTAPLGANFEYSINGTTFQAGTVFSNVSPNTYDVVVRNTTTGCVSLPNTIQINSTIATPPPTVTSPIYYCQNSTASALSVTPAAGTTLKWYTVATGGTASTVAPTPNTGTLGNFTFYVSQTNGSCESIRVPIVVKVTQNFNESLNLVCDPTRSTPTSVFFEWVNMTGYVGYNYTYSIAGGPLVTGYIPSPSSISIPVSGPGTSVTFTITSVVGAPCVTPETQTCHSSCTTITTPNFAAIPPICSGTTAPVLVATSPNGISGTWNPAIISTVAGADYVFTPNSFSFPCTNTQTLTVSITNAVTPTFTNLQTSLCQNAPAPVLPINTSNVPSLSGTWSPATVNTATLGSTFYTFNPTSGQCVTSATVGTFITVNPNVNPNFAGISAICSASTTPVLSTTSPNGITGSWNPAVISNSSSASYLFTPNANQCSSTQTLNVNILNATTADFAAIPSICSGSTAPILATIAPNGTSGTWSPTVIDNLNSGTYTFSPDPSIYTCPTPQVLNVAIASAVTPVFTAIPVLCQNSSAPLLPTSSTNIPPITGTWNSPIDTSLLGNTLYTFTPSANQCVVSVNPTLLVNVLANVTPDFLPIPSFCENTTSPILATNAPNGISGNWNPAIISNTTDASYLFMPTPGQCSSTQTLAVSLIRRTNPDFSGIAALCVGDTAPVLALASPNGINGTWAPTTIDNQLSGNYLFTPDPTVCANTQNLSVTVNQPTIPDFADLTICINSTAPVLNSSSPNGISGTWSPAIVDVTASAPYVFTPVANSCAVPQTIQVVINQPQLNNVVITYEVSDAFSANPIIEVSITPAGNFFYQLDLGPLQDTPIFDQVSHGIHTVTIYDAYACSTPSSTSFEVMVIDYPKFFTPNDDGFNDAWNIYELETTPATIYIFDRMGKLLKQLFPTEDGWDGTYNGAALPATDYWFLVEYEENGSMKRFKSHFALKR